MSKSSRKKHARKQSKANHGNRPNSWGPPARRGIAAGPTRTVAVSVQLDGL